MITGAFAVMRMPPAVREVSAVAAVVVEAAAVTFAAVALIGRGSVVPATHHDFLLMDKILYWVVSTHQSPTVTNT
jgi:hypothetical protein